MDGGITAENFPANGLARAAQTAKCSVASDGTRTRYPGGAYECTWNERALCVNLGGTAGFFSLVPMMGQDFFYFRKGGRSDETEYQTMAGDAFPLIPIHNHHFDFRIGESL